MKKFKILMVSINPNSPELGNTGVRFVPFGFLEGSNLEHVADYLFSCLFMTTFEGMASKDMICTDLSGDFRHLRVDNKKTGDPMFLLEAV